MRAKTASRRGDTIVRAKKAAYASWTGEIRLRAYVTPRLAFPRLVWPTWLWLIGWVFVGSLVGGALEYPGVLDDGLNPARTFIVIGYWGALAISLIQRPWRAKWWPVDGPASTIRPGDVVRGRGRRCWRAAEVAAVWQVGDLVHVAFAPTIPGGPGWPPATYEANAYAGIITIPVY